MMEAAVVVRIDERGEYSYHVFGGDSIRLFLIDERCPHDRVYEWLSRDSADEFRQLIPEGSEIGSSQDERHEAVANVITSHQEGRPHLRVVEPTDQ